MLWAVFTCVIGLVVGYTLGLIASAGVLDELLKEKINNRPGSEGGEEKNHEEDCIA